MHGAFGGERDSTSSSGVILPWTGKTKMLLKLLEALLRNAEFIISFLDYLWDYGARVLVFIFSCLPHILL